MSLKIVDDACRIENGAIIVVVEGDDPEQVLSSTAKQMALQKAAVCGFHRVGINGQTGSFPVNSSGNPCLDWTKAAKDGEISAYRNEIKLLNSF